MKKKKHQKVQEGDIESFNHARRLGSTLPPARYQHMEKPSSEMIPSFTLGDMILSLKEGSNKDARATLHEAFGDCYSYEKLRENSPDKMNEVDNDVYMNSDEEYMYEDSCKTKDWELSIPKSPKQQKHLKPQSYNNKITPLAFNHKENTGVLRPVISNGTLFPNNRSHIVNASCVSEEIICRDFSFSKKVLKKHLLSSSITEFHNPLKENDFINVSEEKEKKSKIYVSKISENKVHDNELLSDLDLYDNDDGIFHFDKEYSSSLQSNKELNGKNKRNMIDRIESDLENEKTCAVIVQEKNPQLFTCSKKIEVSPYSDNEEDLFWTEDFQDENPYVPLFKAQSYERYSSSDDIWDCCSSSFASEPNDASDVADINRIPNEYFFHNDSNMSDRKGDTTDEDQNFIVKKITQKAQKEYTASNDVVEKEISCFVEVTSCTLPSHDSKASILVEEENSESNHVFATSLTTSKTETPNVINKPPLLGTWTRDLRRPMGIIDGTSTNIIDPIASPSTILSPASTSLSPSSIPSLNDILDTSAFVQLSSSNSSSSSITKSYLSDFYRWDRIPIGTFRRHQQRFANTREELIKGEWYVLTSKSRLQQSNVPVLGTTVCRKKKRLRKQKYKNKLKTSIEFENEEEIGKEQCGLGLGPQLSPLFNGLS
ncbi:hypothetical protein PMAC_002937 [Pneumocystis sp. 'macacae']|nr:hypothetical protein PMAC_002937 [Pneumocystis sp. 'macacae']